MKRNKRKGFTLIELIVVIAIIGVLASILVPSVMGYVRKANRSTDLNTAKTIFNDSSIIITDGSENAESYTATNGIDKTVFVTRGGSTETYNLIIVARKDANEDQPWIGFDTAAQTFINELNNMEQANVALKFRRLSNGGELESWFVCRKADDPYSVEVWAGVSAGDELKYRVYPDPDDRYN